MDTGIMDFRRELKQLIEQKATVKTDSEIQLNLLLRMVLKISTAGNIEVLTDIIREKFPKVFIAAYLDQGEAFREAIINIASKN